MDDLEAERVNLAHYIREARGGVVQMWLVVWGWSIEQFFTWWLDWSQGLDYTLERSTLHKIGPVGSTSDSC